MNCNPLFSNTSKKSYNSKEKKRKPWTLFNCILARNEKKAKRSRVSLREKPPKHFLMRLIRLGPDILITITLRVREATHPDN